MSCTRCLAVLCNYCCGSARNCLLVLGEWIGLERRKVPALITGTTGHALSASELFPLGSRLSWGPDWLLTLSLIKKNRKKSSLVCNISEEILIEIMINIRSFPGKELVLLSYQSWVWMAEISILKYYFTNISNRSKVALLAYNIINLSVQLLTIQWVCYVIVCDNW